MEWGILVQRAVNARFIIIRGIPTQDPAQMRLPEYDHVVETFPSDRADQPLDVRVLPRRSGSGRLVPERAERCHSGARSWRGSRLAPPPLPGSGVYPLR